MGMNNTAKEGIHSDMQRGSYSTKYGRSRKAGMKISSAIIGRARKHIAPAR